MDTRESIGLLAPVSRWVGRVLALLVDRGIIRPLRSLVLLLCAKRTFEGVRVYLEPATDRADDVFATMEEALGLIAMHAPRILRRLRHDLRYIVVESQPAPSAHYDSTERACFVDTRYVNEWPVEYIAATLVHEAAHARIDRRGILYSNDKRRRIEQRCVREQIDFARLLPDDNTELLAHLEANLDRVWYTDSMLWDRQLRTMRHLGMPRWVVQWVERKIEKRLGANWREGLPEN